MTDFEQRLGEALFRAQWGDGDYCKDCQEDSGQGHAEDCQWIPILKGAGISHRHPDEWHPLTGHQAVVVRQPDSQAVQLVGKTVHVLEVGEQCAHVRSEDGGTGTIPLDCLQRAIVPSGVSS